MNDLLTILPKTPNLIGVAADHGGYELKECLVGMLREAGHEVIDFGDGQPKLDDDYPDFVVPLARAVACGEVNRHSHLRQRGRGMRCCQQSVRCASELNS